mmetsp:Transcript_106771/g.309748  ORF Transcript_106771/g.309748 Transcript_106771/m.309748 type:complete len:98 (+) Transcript_106771:1386-1679(+)
MPIHVNSACHGQFPGKSVLKERGKEKKKRRRRGEAQAWLLIGCCLVVFRSTCMCCGNAPPHRFNGAQNPPSALCFDPVCPDLATTHFKPVPGRAATS